MPHYEVQFEDVGFASSLKLADAEITHFEAKGFTEQSVKDGSFPAGVLAVCGGNVSADEGRKVFVCVRLLIEADSDVAAEQFRPPVLLLNALSDMMIGSVPGESIELEGNWGVNGAESVEPAPVQRMCG